MNRANLSLVVLLALALAGCEECAREGCDALGQHADNGAEARVAGVVASESDVVANDCQECGFAAADIEAWSVEQEATTEAQVAAALAEPSQGSARAGADGRFSLALSPGHYVVCVNQSCFNAETRASTTTTLNVKLINGVSQGFIGQPGQALRRLAAIFRPLPTESQ